MIPFYTYKDEQQNDELLIMENCSNHNFESQKSLQDIDPRQFRIMNNFQRETQKELQIKQQKWSAMTVVNSQ